MFTRIVDTVKSSMKRKSREDSTEDLTCEEVLVDPVVQLDSSPDSSSSSSQDSFDHLISHPQTKRPRIPRISFTIPPLPSLPAPTFLPAPSYSFLEENRFSVARQRHIEQSYYIPHSVITVFTHFRQGDVIFGLIDERFKVEKQLLKQGYSDLVANNLNESVIMSLSNNKEIRFQGKWHIDYHAKLLTKHKDYLFKPNGKPIPQSKDPAAISAAFRRACKLMVIHRSRDRVSNVHIITKGIDWKRLCHKVKPGDASVCAGITNSEIRAIYRDEKRHGLHPNIFFYDNDQVMMKKRPWDTLALSHHFRHYEQQRNNKEKIIAEVATLSSKRV